MHSVYMDILIRRPEIIYELHSRLLFGVHRMQTKDAALAVAFPDWRGTPGEFGLLFRVLSPNQQLLDMYREHVAKLADNDFIRFFPVLPVPQTSQRICFVRDQAHEKFGQSAMRRRARRAGMREGATEGTPAVSPSPSKRASHWLYMRSSSGHGFQLAIRKCTVAQQSGHQYGLGMLIPDF